MADLVSEHAEWWLHVNDGLLSGCDIIDGVAVIDSSLKLLTARGFLRDNDVSPDAAAALASQFSDGGDGDGRTAESSSLDLFVGEQPFALLWAQPLDAMMISTRGEKRAIVCAAINAGSVLVVTFPSPQKHRVGSVLAAVDKFTHPLRHAAPEAVP